MFLVSFTQNHHPHHEDEQHAHKKGEKAKKKTHTNCVKYRKNNKNCKENI